LLGSAQYYNDVAASGGQGVAYISSVGAGFRLSNVPEATSVDISYASAFSGGISIFVNGQDRGDLAFPASGGWVGSYLTVTFNTSVPAGATFEVVYQSGDVALNVDQLVFNGGGTGGGPTCTDGMQNGDETGIDCGGSCTACPTCSDGEQNGDETGVDCGGSCGSCSFDPVVTSAANASDDILVGGNGASQPGYTLYTWDNDNGGPFSQCEGGCASTWPPATVASLDAAVIGPLGSGFDGTFGVVGRCDGTLQLTYNNEPLYFYSGDNAPGQTNGDQPSGTWHLVKATVAPPDPTCEDGIQNGNETGIDCGGPDCVACPPVIVEGQCEGYGGSYVGGVGYLYSHVSLGAPCYMCPGPGFSGCNTNFTLEGDFYVMPVQVTPGQAYSFGIQCGPNVIVEGTIGEGTNCWLTPSCNDGVQNGNETDVDCGGPDCGACPTCDDGLMNGLETGIDCGGPECVDCAVVCNGTPNPEATVVATHETQEGNNDGTITFTFNNAPGRSTIQFSLDGGNSYGFSAADNAGSYTISGLAPGTYEMYTRWQGGDCPLGLGSVTIAQGPPAPTCSDGILNQGEEGVDCGGPCTECLPNACGDIPLVTYPKPALPTAVVGADAGQGFALDLSTDLASVGVRYGSVVDIQSGGNPNFEFFCSCNQIAFYSADLSSGTANVPTPCTAGGDYYYFVRYRKQGNTTDDPGDIYVYSALFTTSGARIDPDNRSTMVSGGANWMRFRHPHAQDGITEAVFDAQHNGDLLRNLDRFETVFTDAASGLTIDPVLTRGDANSQHPHGGVDNAAVIRIDYMEKGDASPPTYAKSAGEYAGKWGWGNIITYEITAVTGGSGAQTYNTFQNYVIGEGLNTFGDPRNASAGRATTNMVLPGFGSHKQMEHDAIFTQHIITLEDEDDVDDFLEGHHLFHGVRHRVNGADAANELGVAPIGTESCGNCHFRDGRGSEVNQTPRGPRVPPAVIGVGLLEWIAGREAGFRWDGGASTVREQSINALAEDHGIDATDPNQISAQDLDQLVKYVEFLSVPARSYAAHDDGQVQTGNVKFIEAGCAGCHTVTQRTRNDAPAEFRSIVLRPYTDMKLHTVTDAPYRTPALWGLGRNIQLLQDNGRALLLMHDGRATTLEEAIQSHGGEASGSRAAYNAMSNSDKEALIAFLESL
ncbi:MAG: di-heme oxidoredictase family protein, partial [Bacteroidota bacterium]